MSDSDSDDSKSKSGSSSGSGSGSGSGSDSKSESEESEQSEISEVSSVSPKKKYRFELDSPFVHARDYKTPSAYLKAIINKQHKPANEQSVYSKVKVEYFAKLVHPFKLRIEEGKAGEQPE